MLAGLGAKVIKIERPDGGDFARTTPPYIGRSGAHLGAEDDDDLTLSFINRARGKLSVTLNLKDPQGVEVFRELAQAADVLVQNNSVGTMEKLGLGYEELAAVNPALVYCSVSGFGADATGADRRGFDPIAQALSGMMGATGEADGPPLLQGVVLGDVIGPLMGVIGTLAALRERETSGLGQHVDISMLDGLTALVAAEHYDVLERLGIPTRTGNSLGRMAPSGAYPTSDGYVAICAPTDGFMTGLAEAMGRPELMDEPRFKTRGLRTINRTDLEQLIEAWTRSVDGEEAVRILSDHGVPAGVVRDPTSAVADPRVRERGAVVPLRHPRHGATAEASGMGIPIVFSRSEANLRDRDAPFLGEHKEIVLEEVLGYDSERISELIRSAVI
jgi:crotonobetainyl-CoA:carnitine CoA-transferase CaiB-like acyl-CoA transferase